MTPPKAAQTLLRAAPKSQVVMLEAGHSLMTECSDGVLSALLGFLTPPRPDVAVLSIP
jgi:pimeloyl-ACP methyl ester carboxylesterase